MAGVVAVTGGAVCDVVTGGVGGGVAALVGVPGSVVSPGVVGWLSSRRGVVRGGPVRISCGIPGTASTSAITMAGNVGGGVAAVVRSGAAALDGVVTTTDVARTAAVVEVVDAEGTVVLDRNGSPRTTWPPATVRTCSVPVVKRRFRPSRLSPASMPTTGTARRRRSSWAFTAAAC